MPLRFFRFPDDVDALLAITMAAFQFPDNETWNVPTNLDELLADQLDAARQMWPLVRLASLVQPRLRSLLGGAVWEEDGQVVGAANVVRTAVSPNFEIGNVGVLRDYRRRGIGRVVVMACMDWARQHGARLIFLNVTEGNTPAICLYESLGFEQFDGSDELVYHETPCSQPPPLPPGYTLHSRHFHDWRDDYRLAKRITPAHVQEFEPVQPALFKMPLVLRRLAPTFYRKAGMNRSGLSLHNEAGEVIATAAITLQTAMQSVILKLDPDYSHLAKTWLQVILSRVPAPLTLSLRQSWITPTALDMGFTLDFHYLRMGVVVE